MPSRERLVTRLLGVLWGLCWLAGVAAAHGQEGHSQAEQLPYAVVALTGIAAVAVGVVGERRSLLSSRRIIDAAVLGGALLALGGLVGLQFL